jgi:diguanylate cyclase (GGDEF)-like protein/PAS domain S-box-containing protein
MRERIEMPDASTILIVDDEANNRKTMEALLAPLGYNLAYAGDGVEALAKAAELTPDLILLDVMMPNLDGFEVCRRLRADPRLAEVSIILVTALDDRDSRLQGIEAGADDFASKPYDRAELRARVRTIMRLNRYRRLHEEKAKFERLVELSPDGILLVDAQAKIQLANPAMHRMLRVENGHSLDKEQSLMAYVAPDERDRCQTRFSHVIADPADVARTETVFVREGGERFPVEVVVGHMPWQGQPTVQIIVRDITERKQAEEQMRVLAYHDPLTGLPNRSLFHTLLHQALAQARRTQRTGAVIFIDLDHFKIINDALGHALGDLLLRHAAARVSGCLRESDTVARLGGDEFTVLLGDISQAADAVTVAKKILDALAAPFDLSGNEAFVTASLGISVFPGDGEDLQTLLKNADTALYRAKEQGRNGYAFYTADMNAEALQRLKLENSLRRALERQEFTVYYQPRIALDTGQVIGVEALLRWQHPEIGLVLPGQFISLAEETGLIVPIGEWVLRAACAQVKAWQAVGFSPLRLSVNLSGRQLRQPDVVEMVARALHDTGSDPRCLELELTESILMQDAADTIAKLQRLKGLGVQLAIDDFGTGYSSLEYLSRFPLDRLKIDRSFVRNVTGDADDGTIVRTIIAMAHGLKLKVTAEGVETAEQLGFLRTSRCDEMQGYYFGAPVPPDQCVKML